MSARPTPVLPPSPVSPAGSAGPCGRSGVSGKPDDAERMSVVLARFRASLPPERVSLGDLLAALGERSLGSVLFALALPTIMPVPLGISVIADLPVLFFTLGLALSGREPALPAWLRQRSVSRAQAERLLDAVLPRIGSIERVLRPRHFRLLTRFSRRQLGGVLLLLALVAIIPLPLTGWLPGFALVFLALALIEHDGLAFAAALTLGLAGLVMMALMVTGMLHADQILAFFARIQAGSP